MVKERVVMNGRIITTNNLVRGGMLIHDEAEWRKRYETPLRREIRRSLLVVAILGAMGFFFFAFIGVDAGFPLAEVAQMLLFYSGIVTLFTWAMWRLAIWYRGRRPAVGLYETGVQTVPSLFIPYWEISSIKEPQGDVSVDRSISLEWKLTPSPMTRFTTQQEWRLSSKFLGEDGIAELDRRVRGDVTDESPPKLVIYGPR